MYLIITASKDTYITNKIIDNDFRAKDANVGRAGTIDIFKLYDESTYLSGSTRITGSVREGSRGLIKFDYGSLESLTGSSIDINSSRFKATLKMFDIMAGQATPSGFNMVVYPLSQSFDEGVGRDVASFGDLDVANWVTASYSNSTVNAWNKSGSNSGGFLNATNIDYITSGTVGSSTVDFGGSQYFKTGNEDLEIDVTKIVSASLAGILTNHGFRVSFSGSDDTDNKSRFVKRFASRHSSNPLKVPQVHVQWDDSIEDHHNDFVFNTSGSIFLRNYVRGKPSNFVSGSSFTSISGDDCILFKIEVQDYVQYLSASQHTAGTDDSAITGLYSASFAVSSFEKNNVNSSGQKMSDLIEKSGSVKFKTFWLSADESIGYYTGSLEISPSRKSYFKRQPSDLLFHFVNLQPEYQTTDKTFITVFVEDLSLEDKVYKIPYSKTSVSLSDVYYRVRDMATNTVVIPFDSDYKSTQLSSDGGGLSFYFHMSSLPKGRVYCFDLLVKDYGENRTYSEASGRFKVI